MRRSERDEWTAGLRSGEFPQAHGALKVNLGDDHWGYCCLGVKCELDARAGRHGVGSEVRDGDAWFGISGASDWRSAMPSPAILQAWDLRPSQADKLADMNDTDRQSFAAIADWIEENVPVTDDDTGTVDTV